MSFHFERQEKIYLKNEKKGFFHKTDGESANIKHTNKLKDEYMYV